MDAVVGIVAKTGLAVAVTLSIVFDEPMLRDRRTLVFETDDAKRFVYHQAQTLAPKDALAFVKQTRTTIARRARTEVDSLLRDAERGGTRIVSVGVVDAATPLAVTGLERILASHTLLHAAEGDLYRSVVIDAFARHGLDVEPVPRPDVASRAQRAIGHDTTALLTRLGRDAGPPLRKEHKDAALVALAAAGG